MKYRLKQEHIPVLNPEQVVDEFLDMNKRWFEDPSNGFFGYRQRFYQYCLSRICSGIWPDDYNDNNLIHIEHYFDEYLGLYNVVEGE